MGSVVDDIQKLNLPAGKYVVVGSAVMDVLDIREAGDIDILVTEDLFEKMKNSTEWELAPAPIDWKIKLVKDGVEVFWSMRIEDLYTTPTEELIQKALKIEDILFMNLDELIKFKTALGREKDKRDIELIREYQKKDE